MPVTAEISLGTARWREVRPWRACIVLAAGITALLLFWSFVPRYDDSPRYWLTWLGNRILAGAMPHALGAESPAWAGAPWLPTQWLYAATTALFVRADMYPLLALVNGVCASAPVWWSLAYTVRRRVPPMPVFVLLLAIAVPLVSGYGLRAASFALVFPFAELWLIERRRYWTIVPLIALWANVHGSFVLGIALFACVVIVNLAKHRYAILLPFAAAMLATLCSPFGFALWPYTIAMTHAWYAPYITEWQPTAAVMPAAAILLLATLLAFVPKLRKGRPLDEFWPMPIVMTVGGLIAVRNVAIALAVAGSIALSSIRDSLSRLEVQPPVWLPVLLCAAILARFGEIDSLRWGVSIEPEYDLIASRGSPLVALQHVPIAGRQAYCDDGYLCDAVLLLGGRTLYDGRNDAFPPAALPVLQGRALNVTQVEKLKADTVLVSQTQNIGTMARQRGWRKTLTTPSFTLFERSP